MDKNMREFIKVAKQLHKKGLIYMSDSIELEVEPNYQVLALIFEELNLVMSKEEYDLIDSKEELIHKLALLSFKENELIDDMDIEFREHIIKEYVDIEDPVVIFDTYIFDVDLDKLEEVYEKCLKQIKEGKFKNYI